MEIVTISTPEIGDRSYLVTDGHHALVIDPQRDIDRVVRAADERGVRITTVVETHIHNDYLTGGLALARLTGARYGVSGHEAVAFKRDPLADGDRLRVGELVVDVVATPGHTPNHLSFVVTHPNQLGTNTMAVFSGGSLLFGAAGRTDLAGTGLTDLLARAQWASIRHLAALVSADASVHPTHGFGSFCAAGGAGNVDGSTIRHERAVNPALILSQDDFVDDLIARVVAYPRYYSYMAPRNRAGVAPADLTGSHLAGPAELGERVRRGEWVVDLRPRRAFAARHLAGTINVELGDQLATYLGWVFPWGSPLSLMAETADQLAAARRNLARIGLEDVVAESTAAIQDLALAGEVRSYPVSSFAELDGRRGRGETPFVLDVRHPHEWSAGHLHGARHIPVQDLEGTLSSLPRGRAVWVHCAAGYRAALASSLLDRRGFPVHLIDDRWDNARSATAA
jgi:hydroxyacylglutathione hydrolase